MAKLGKHTKWTIAAQHRETVRRILTEGLGLEAKPGPAPDFDLYATDDGGAVGIKFVDRSDALDDVSQSKSAWLEFAVKDAQHGAARLAELGARPVDYTDESHAYFQFPGGPVFRLAEE